MKKIKNFFKRFFSTFTVKMNQRPVMMTVLILLGVNIAILAIAAGIAMVLEPNDYPTYYLAFAQTVRWLILPNSVTQIVGAGKTPLLFLAVTVVVIGMVLFTGTIIAIITTYLRGYISQKSEAKGKLPLANHIVILNYNSEVTSILIDLMFAKTKQTVMILSDKTKDTIQNELAAELAMLTEKPKSNLKMIVRKGDPTSLAELQDISIDEAGGILIMQPPQTDENGDDQNVADYEILKLVMKLSNLNISPACPIGIETALQETADKIHRLKQHIPGLQNKSIQPFSHNTKLGQFLALTILCPSLSEIFTELLTYSGCVLHPVKKTDSLEDFLSHHACALPVIGMDNKTYVLTDDLDACEKTRRAPFATTRRLRSIPYQMPDKIKLYVIGENKKTTDMLSALEAGNENDSCVRKTDIKRYVSQEYQQFARDLAEYGDHNTVALILSDDRVPHRQLDANVLMTLIELSGAMDLRSRPFKIIAELLVPENQKAIEELSIRNIIVSTRIISFFATKLLCDPDAERFYEEVFAHASEKFDIWVEKAKHLFDFSDNTTFHSYAEFVHAAYFGSDKKRMPLGMIRGGENIFFCTDMDRQREFTLDPSDKILYVEYLDL